jgi:hypothetical protein
MFHVLTEEKLDETGGLKHTPQESVRCLAQETGISKSNISYFSNKAV